jgi:4-hydroxy-4-methyl-2-oxoglutarate aldolase
MEASKADLQSAFAAGGTASPRLTAALVLDALDAAGLRRQAIQSGIVPRTSRQPVIGRAKTLLWVDFAHDDPATYALELEAVDSVTAGEVIVCATGGSPRSGIWGELLTTAAGNRGAAGVVTDGAVRDLAQMEAAGFPVFSQHVSAYDSFNRQKVVAYDVRVEIGGVTIEPGDLIVADLDGIIVVPAAIEAEILARAAEKASREDGFRAAVSGGMSLTTAYERFKVL